MQNNVININRNREDIIPEDLMTFKALGIKHNLKYGFLYKWACMKNEIHIYDRGTLMLSEKEVIEFVEKRAKKYGKH